MYLNEDFHNYKYLVDYSDNYIVLSKSNKIYGESGDIDTIDVLVQYFNPSELSFETSYSSYETRSFTDISDTFSTDLFDRTDFPYIYTIGFITLFIIIFVFNQLSKLFKKGGILGGLS